MRRWRQRPVRVLLASWGSGAWRLRVCAGAAARARRRPRRRLWWLTWVLRASRRGDTWRLRGRAGTAFAPCGLGMHLGGCGGGGWCGCPAPRGSVAPGGTGLGMRAGTVLMPHELGASPADLLHPRADSLSGGRPR
ncbi:hypothetical protein PAHAL_8G058500 [Panicum hallii]|uniref:Secreted protein n=1 Tax=Panicum hallii TaxID=206008 RepID=A0A2T8I7U9_9POAL|nr:hypothetical protein PAHAL_8G058500 [Panicum hallii]